MRGRWKGEMGPWDHVRKLDLGARIVEKMPLRMTLIDNVHAEGGLRDISPSFYRRVS